MGGYYFCTITLFPPPLPSPSSPQSWEYCPTCHVLIIIPVTARQPLPVWPLCLLIILLWSAQSEVLSTLSLLPIWPTNHSSRYFMHALERLNTFDLITERAVSVTVLSPLFLHLAIPPTLLLCILNILYLTYLRRRYWIPAEKWKSQKWNEAGPWSSHTGQH